MAINNIEDIIDELDIDEFAYYEGRYGVHNT